MADKFQYKYSDPSSNACEIDLPFGAYQDDDSFCSESINVCKWTARRLGHPVMQLEFDSGSLYSMFQEAISEYSQHINQYNTKNWMWEHYGNSIKESGSSFESASMSGSDVIHPNMGTAVVLSNQYGNAIGSGGDVTMYSASISLSSSRQEYDLQSAFSQSLIDGGIEYGSATTGDERIVVHNVFNYGPTAVSRHYDPFIGSFDQRMMLDEFGFANYSPATTFILKPINFDVLRAQAIETSDKIRKSNYSFELNNNKVRIFPAPETNDDGNKIWFQFALRKEANAVTQDYTTNAVSDPSNVPYKFIPYQMINSAGRQWIRKYTLALSKELLGIIRSKYASMPLPNGEVTMDGEALKTEGREEKQQLLEELNVFLESVTLKEKAVAEQEVADAQQQVLNKAPLGIYLG
tara:strand:- start:2487 stop:3707 length:1221 start_codon:yes stop_codon:yes gene_type:complete